VWKSAISTANVIQALEKYAVPILGIQYDLVVRRSEATEFIVVCPKQDQLTLLSYFRIAAIHITRRLSRANADSVEADLEPVTPVERYLFALVRDDKGINL
jgi:hypothetical protein